MEYANYNYPENMMLGHQGQEYLSTLNTYRHSFDMGYTNNYSDNYSQYYTQETHDTADDNSSDSGVPSDNMEDYSDVSPVSVSPGVSHTPNYYKEHDVKNWGQIKPLSAWKMKQLRLTPAGIKKRRRDANARERKRMNGLNDAFERLRDAVPGMEEKSDKNKKLSKMDTLQMANLYIRHLVTLLNTETSTTDK